MAALCGGRRREGISLSHVKKCRENRSVYVSCASFQPCCRRRRWRYGQQYDVRVTTLFREYAPALWQGDRRRRRGPWLVPSLFMNGKTAFISLPIKVAADLDGRLRTPMNTRIRNANKNKWFTDGYGLSRMGIWRRRSPYNYSIQYVEIVNVFQSAHAPHPHFSHDKPKLLVPNAPTKRVTTVAAASSKWQPRDLRSEKVKKPHAGSVQARLGRRKCVLMEHHLLDRVGEMLIHGAGETAFRC